MKLKLFLSTCIIYTFIFTFLTSNVAFANNNRWEYIGDSVYYGTDLPSPQQTYIDTQKLQYNSISGIASFWIKLVSDEMKWTDNCTAIEYIELDIKNKKWRKLRSKWWDSKQVTNFVNPEWKSADFREHPEYYIELAVDYISHKYNFVLLHPEGKNRWKWLLSTNDLTFTYAVDSVRFEKNLKKVYFVGRLKYTNGKEYTNEFIIDYKNYKYNRLWKGMETQDIMPDTFYELVADAVSNVIGQP